MGEIYKCCDNPQITYLSAVNINIDKRQQAVQMFGDVEFVRKNFVKKNSWEQNQ